MSKALNFITALLVITIPMQSNASARYEKNGNNTDIYVHNNDLINLILSEKEINRIAIANEKIKSIHFFRLQKNTVFTGDEIVAGFAYKIQILDSGKEVLVILL